MPRSRVSDKFSVCVPTKDGALKGKYHIGINRNYRRGKGVVTLSNLISFVRRKRLNPSKVQIDKGFGCLATVLGT